MDRLGHGRTGSTQHQNSAEELVERVEINKTVVFAIRLSCVAISLPSDDDVGGGLVSCRVLDGEGDSPRSIG